MMNQVKYYRWQGIDSNRQKICGDIQAPNKIIAAIYLRQQKIEIKKIKTDWKHYLGRHQKLTTQDIIVFIRQLAILLNAQVPLIQALNTLKKGYRINKMRMLIENIADEIQHGVSLAHALRKYPHYFNPFICTLVDAGEQSGALGPLIFKIAQYEEYKININKKIKRAMLYPWIILGFSGLVMTALLFFVIPQFEFLFNHFGANLPKFTQCIIKIAQILQVYGPLFIAFSISQFFICRYLYCRIESIAISIDQLCLKLPYIGQLIQESMITQLTQTLSITLVSGLPLLEALFISRQITTNKVHIRAINQIRTSVAEGMNLQTAFEKTQCVPNMMIQMIAIGEESGRLEAMLAHVARQYHETFAMSIELLSRLLEPGLMIFLGLLIGLLIVAMYLPIFQFGAIV